MCRPQCSYQAFPHQTQCFQCAKGYAVEVRGQLQCESLVWLDSPNSTRLLRSVLLPCCLSSCVLVRCAGNPCIPGEYSDVQGASICLKCPAGDSLPLSLGTVICPDCVCVRCNAQARCRIARPRPRVASATREVTPVRLQSRLLPLAVPIFNPFVLQTRRASSSVRTARLVSTRLQPTNPSQNARYEYVASSW